jgi:hypothetical protein
MTQVADRTPDYGRFIQLATLPGTTNRLVNFIYAGGESCCLLDATPRERDKQKMCDVCHRDFLLVPTPSPRFSTVSKEAGPFHMLGSKNNGLFYMAVGSKIIIHNMRIFISRPYWPAVMTNMDKSQPCTASGIVL